MHSRPHIDGYSEHRSFIASVQELMRAEAQDQIEWTERRRRRLRPGAGGTNLPRATAMTISSSSPKTLRTKESQSSSPKTLRTEECQRHNRRQPQRRAGRKSATTEKNEPKAMKEVLDPTQAMIRIGQLKSTLAKATDPPAVAAELAVLYLVLSDQRGALRSFQVAVKPSPGELDHLEETHQPITETADS